MGLFRRKLAREGYFCQCHGSAAGGCALPIESLSSECRSDRLCAESSDTSVRAKPSDFLIEGLRRLEYRGYDSAGVATITPTASSRVTKRAGRLDNLVRSLAEHPPAGTIGIGHTRWATHGAGDRRQRPSAPRRRRRSWRSSTTASSRTIRPLKERLESEGYVFRSATDTEVIAHLIASCLDEAVGRTRHGNAQRMRRPIGYAAAGRGGPARPWRKLQGTYGLAILFRDYPDVIIAARLGSPLVVGVGDGEHFLASDASPLVGYTDKIVYLADHELAVLTADSLRVIHRDQGHVAPQRARARHRSRRRRAGRLSRTTCSRRSSSSPRRFATPCAAGSTSTTADGRVRRPESRRRSSCAGRTASC